MSYQVLARKWRPRTFQEMTGQEHVLRMLSNALQQNRIHHAYLFTGTRGVGKTTVARIFAKCLNCESGISAEACGQCASCVAFDAGKFIDLYEVDAASRTKVEDTRELLDNVLYPPTIGRYKIYLIDEVHMLSNHSFNALLKTLEEPPPHVKFLFATTDPKRLPITVLSRCLQFNLKSMTVNEISHRLAHICNAENISYEPPALNQIAKAADGSMRDSLSLLDQAVAYGNGAITLHDIRSMFRFMAQDDLMPLIHAIADQNGQLVFELIAQLAEHAPDFSQILEEFIHLLHQVAVLQITKQNNDENETLNVLAKKLTAEEVQLYYQIALLGRRDLSYTPDPRQGFEMTLLRMLAFKPSVASTHTANTTPEKNTCAVGHSQRNTASISANSPHTKVVTPNILNTVSTPEISEAQMQSATSTAISEAQIQSAAAIADMNSSNSEKDSATTKTSVSNCALNEWRDLLPKLELSGMAYALASNCTLEKVETDRITLCLSANHQPMLTPKLQERIAEALARFYKRTTIALEIVIAKSGTQLLTPTKQQADELADKLSKAKQTILDDPHVQQLIDMYDATVEVSLAAT